MAELLIFAHDHSADSNVSTDQAFALPRLFDLIVWQLDDYLWGSAELTSPKFRLITCTLPDEVLSSLTSLGVLPYEDQRFPPFRSSFLDLSQPMISNIRFASWWGDERRLKRTFTFFEDLTALIKAR